MARTSLFVKYNVKSGAPISFSETDFVNKIDVVMQ